MFLAQYRFARCDRQAKTIRRFFFYADFAGYIGERQADAHGVGQRFDADLFVFRVGAKRAKRQANQGEQEDSEFFHGKIVTS